VVGRGSDTSVTFPTNGDLMVWVNNGGGSFGYSGNFIWSSPAIGVDGTIYVGGGDGYFYAEGSQVNTIPVTGLSIAPSPIPGGQTATGTVTISEEPPVGAGDVVTLSSSTPAVATLVTPVTVQWNATSATFQINTVPVQTDTTVTVYATSGGVTKSSAFVVKAPYPTALAVSPTSVQGSSNTTVEGQVTLSGAAPPGGVVVSLSSSNTNAATVPSTVSIPPGQTKGTFIVSHSKVTTQTSVTLTATLNGASATATLTVTAG